MPRVHCRNCKLRFTPSTSAAVRAGLCPDCQDEIDNLAPAEPRWFVLLDNEMEGPHDWSQLRSLAARGTIGPDDMLTQEGSGHFVRARAVRGLFDGASLETVRRETPAKDTDWEPPSEHVSDLNDLLAGLDFAPAPRVRKKTPPEPVETDEPELAPAPRAPKKAPLAPTSVPIEAFPTPVDCTMPTAETPPPGEAPSGRPLVETRSKWPFVGAGTLFILAAAFFGFQWLQNNHLSDRNRPGGSVEEQETVRDDRPKKTSAIKSEKDLLSSADRLSRVVERLNRHRKEAGLAEVMLDPTLSRACAEQALTLARSAASNPSEQAAALVAHMEPTQAIEHWIGRLASRVQLLAPELERVGIGFEQNTKGAWICVLDPVGGRDELVKTYPITTQGAGSTARAVAYPAPHQKNVPCTDFDRIEGVKPVGFPLSLAFPATTILRGVQASLMDDKHNAVEVRVSSPEQPLNVKLQRGGIGIYPTRPLEPGRTYLVLVNALVNDAEWRHVWRFTTSK